MTRTCKSCGKDYSGEYCPHCGYGDPNLKTHAADKYKKSTVPERFMTDEQKKEYRKTTAKKTNKRVVYFVIFLCAVVAATFLTLYFSGSIGKAKSCEEVCKRYITAVNERDFDSFVSCFYGEMRADFRDDRDKTGLSKDDYMKTFAEDFASRFGDDFTITPKVIHKERLKDFSMNGYEEAYGSVPKISQAQIVTVELKFKGSKGEETDRADFYVGKVGRKWYLFNMVVT